MHTKALTVKITEEKYLILIELLMTRFRCKTMAEVIPRLIEFAYRNHIIIK